MHKFAQAIFLRNVKLLDRQGITGSVGKNWKGIGVTNQIGGLAKRNKGEGI